MTNAPVILFSSLSAKISLYEQVLRGARRFHPQAKLVGSDSNPNCPAASKVETFTEMPPLDTLDKDGLLGFCAELGITHVIPTRDGELDFWARNRDALHKRGVSVMVSSQEAVETCLDKLLFYKQMKSASIPPIPTVKNTNELGAERFVAKERNGSASCSIGLDLDSKEASDHALNLQAPIFQPMLKGPEFSAETWIDARGKCHGMVLRWRTKIVDGEAHESEIFDKPDWERRMRDTFESLPGLSGHALAQVIVSDDQSLSLVEINARLGGASPLALSADLHSIEWFLLQTEKRECEIPEFPVTNKNLRLSKINGEAIIS